MDNLIKTIKKLKITPEDLSPELKQRFDELDLRVDKYNSSVETAEADNDTSSDVFEALKLESTQIDETEEQLIFDVKLWKKELDDEAEKAKAKADADKQAAIDAENAKAKEEENKRKAQEDADALAAKEQADKQAAMLAQQEEEKAAEIAKQQADEAEKTKSAEEKKGSGLLGWLVGATLFVVTLGAINSRMKG